MEQILRKLLQDLKWSYNHGTSHIRYYRDAEVGTSNYTSLSCIVWYRVTADI